MVFSNWIRRIKELIYIYCTRRSNGARDLVNKLNQDAPGSARRLRRWNRVQQQDLVVNWGDRNILDASNVLNPVLPANKLAELVVLREGGVPTVPFSTDKEQPNWLARTMHHQEARDLRANLRRGDYYVQFVPVVREFRIHIWRGKSIRTGIKMPRIDNPDTRFRSWEAGWKLDYGTVCQENMRQTYRDIAKRAIRVLGLDFGAVDLGIRPNGSVVVFEVNSAPGLEGNTIDAYAHAIKTTQENS